MSRSSRHTLIAAGLVCLIGVFYLATIRVGHVWGDDHAAYIHHAKNIAEGVKYENIGYLRSPTAITPMAYPPVFPLLLAPVYHHFGLSLTPMKVLEIGFFCAALFFLYQLLKDENSPRLALATVALIGFCPYFWDFKDTILSDFPFMAFTYGALLVAKRAEAYQNARNWLVLLGLIAGGLSFLAYGTRSVGIVLLPAILLREFVTIRKLTWFGISTGIVFIIGVVTQKLLINVESDYLNSWTQVLSVRALLGSPKYYLVCLSVLLENGHSQFVQMVTFTVVGVIAIYGAWLRLRKEPALVDLFVVLYALLIVCFPWGGRRYLIPILPFYVFYFLVGLRELNARFPRSARTMIQAGAFAVIAACFAAKYATVNWREVPGGMQGKEVTEMLEYVRHDVGRDGVVVFTKARFLALYGDTRAADIYYADAPGKAFDFYRGIGVTHLVLTQVVDPNRNDYLARLIAERPELFEKTFDNGDFAVYRMTRS